MNIVPRMHARKERVSCQRTRSWPSGAAGAPPGEGVRVRRTVYAYDTDTWENPAIFSPKVSVSRAIDAKIVSRTGVSIENYPEIVKVLDNFKKRVSSKKGVHSARLFLNTPSTTTAWTSPLEIYRGLRQWALKFLPLEKLFGCKKNAERFLSNFKHVLGSGKCSHIRVQGNRSHSSVTHVLFTCDLSHVFCPRKDFKIE